MSPDLATALPTRTAASARLIDAVADDLARRVDEIGAEIAALLESRGVTLEGHPHLLGVCRDGVRLLMDLTRSWSDPSVTSLPQESRSWAQSLVARQVRAEDLVQMFQHGQARYLATWHAELGRAPTDADVRMEAISAISAFVFAWVDALCVPLVAACSEARSHRTQLADADREAELDRVLRGEVRAVRASEARLGHPLGGRHHALVLWVPGDADLLERRASLEHLLLQLAPLLMDSPRGTPLISWSAPGMVRAWFTGEGMRLEDERLAAAASSYGAAVALGTPAVGPEGFRTSATEAMHAQRVARLLYPERVVTRYAGVALEDLLTRDVDRARAFAHSTLGELAAGTPVATCLLETLRCFYAEQEGVRRTARRLGVHENTVGSRVRRAAKLAGHENPGSWDLRVAVSLAPLVTAERRDP